MPVLFATVLIDLIGFGIIIPILPFLAPKLGGSAFDIALHVVFQDQVSHLIEFDPAAIGGRQESSHGVAPGEHNPCIGRCGQLLGVDIDDSGSILGDCASG